ncbi:MAG TPA: pyridoxal-phosphate dependent enzyme [Actinoplanes sp.]|jgi:2,3-diaminopropionate biosynthesis protein SbnA
MFETTLGWTPLQAVRIDLRGRPHTACFKLESANPTGSSKDRTASAILQVMHAERPLSPGDVVVESTSGNLGIALAHLLNQIGCRLIAVTDPNTSTDIRRTLEAEGVEVQVVDEPDGHGGYLLNRLRRVRDLRTANPAYRWGNQYENPANPAVHERTTGPEILAQAGAGLDAVYVAVSTGGTLSGISRFLRANAPSVTVVAVDAHGSRATGGEAGPRLLSGIGASRISSFLDDGAYDAVKMVSDADSFALCRILRDDTGLRLGGSSGSVLAALLDDLRGNTPPRHPVCLMPDGGERYEHTFYDDAWLMSHQAFDAVCQAEKELRGDGLAFTLSD